MPTHLEEGYQRFTFDHTWSVFCYDCKDAGYWTIRDSVQGTKSCDFLGIHGSAAWLIEIKDFRGYRIQNKARMKDGDLVNEVAQKARDTIAGIASGVRRVDPVRPWQQIWKDHFGDARKAVVVCLLIEDDAAADEERWKVHLNVLAQQIKQKLHWLRVRVIVQSPNRFPGSVPGLMATNLDGACGYA